MAERANPGVSLYLRAPSSKSAPMNSGTGSPSRADLMAGASRSAMGRRPALPGRRDRPAAGARHCPAVRGGVADGAVRVRLELVRGDGARGAAGGVEAV